MSIDGVLGVRTLTSCPVAMSMAVYTVPDALIREKKYTI